MIYDHNIQHLIALSSKPQSLQAASLWRCFRTTPQGRIWTYWRKYVSVSTGSILGFAQRSRWRWLDREVAEFLCWSDYPRNPDPDKQLEDGWMDRSTDGQKRFSNFGMQKWTVSSEPAKEALLAFSYRALCCWTRSWPGSGQRLTRCCRLKMKTFLCNSTAVVMLATCLCSNEVLASIHIQMLITWAEENSS